MFFFKFILKINFFFKKNKACARDSRRPSPFQVGFLIFSALFLFFQQLLNFFDLLVIFSTGFSTFQHKQPFLAIGIFFEYFVNARNILSPIFYARCWFFSVTREYSIDINMTSTWHQRYKHREGPLQAPFALKGAFFF